MAEEFYLVKIGSVTLSDDGTDSGRACLVKVDNMAQLFPAYVGATRVPLSGRAFNFVAENEGANVRLIIRPFALNESTLSSLQALIDAATLAGSTIAVGISDGPGAISLNCDPLWEDDKPPLNFGPNFYNSDLYDVEIRMITRGFRIEGP